MSFLEKKKLNILNNDVKIIINYVCKNSNILSVNLVASCCFALISWKYSSIKEFGSFLYWNINLVWLFQFYFLKAVFVF